MTEHGPTERKGWTCECGTANGRTSLWCGLCGQDVSFSLDAARAEVEQREKVWLGRLTDADKREATQHARAEAAERNVAELAEALEQILPSCAVQVSTVFPAFVEQTRALLARIREAAPGGGT